jgi:hypothetical protein
MIGSALVVLVPEAEASVKPFRDRYDPSAAAGMPAHITLLYPFKPPDEVDEAVLGNLRHCFTRFARIQFSLNSIRRFPVEVLYLAPEPDGCRSRTCARSLMFWSLPHLTPLRGEGFELHKAVATQRAGGRPSAYSSWSNRGKALPDRGKSLPEWPRTQHEPALGSVVNASRELLNVCLSVAGLGVRFRRRWLRHAGRAGVWPSMHGGPIGRSSPGRKDAQQYQNTAPD